MLNLSELLIAVIIIFMVYLACPYLFFYCTGVRNAFLFANRLNIPRHPLHDLNHYKVNKAKNYTISMGGKDCINLWSISNMTDDNNKTVIVYCHGNSCNRAMTHRIGLYNTLRQFGYHVVTFDYRGYGDSRGPSPNEFSVVKDVQTVIEWTLDHLPDYNIILWGHSLGTGISIKVLSDAEKYKHSIKGLVLESPFLSSGEAGRHFPIAKIFEYLPFTSGVIGDALEGLFPSDQLIANVPVPIIILHATDDLIIPVHNGIQLEKVCREKGKLDISAKIVNEGKHKFLYKNKEAMSAAVKFIDTVTK